MSCGGRGSQQQQIEDGGVNRCFEMNSRLNTGDPADVSLNRRQSIKSHVNPFTNVGTVHELDLASINREIDNANPEPRFAVSLHGGFDRSTNARSLARLSLVGHEFGSDVETQAGGSIGKPADFCVDRRIGHDQTNQFSSFERNRGFNPTAIWRKVNHECRSFFTVGQFQ